MVKVINMDDRNIFFVFLIILMIIVIALCYRSQYLGSVHFISVTIQSLLIGVGWGMGGGGGKKGVHENCTILINGEGVFL